MLDIYLKERFMVLKEIEADLMELFQLFELTFLLNTWEYYVLFGTIGSQKID